MIEMIKRVVADMMGLQAKTQYGTVSAYNPNDYTIKAIIQPEGIETGWIPLASPWVGNNLGAVFGPAINDQVRLDFVGGEIEASIAGGRFFNVNARPPIVNSGQAAIVDGSGSYVRLNNDGTITLGANTGITSTTPLLKQTGNMEVTGTATFDSAVTMKTTLAVTGATTMQNTLDITGITTMKAAASVAGVATVGGLAATGAAGSATVSGSLTITGGNVTADGISLKTHVHSDPQGGLTGVPQ